MGQRGPPSHNMWYPQSSQTPKHHKQLKDYSIVVTPVSMPNRVIVGGESRTGRRMPRNPRWKWRAVRGTQVREPWPHSRTTTQPPSGGCCAMPLLSIRALAPLPATGATLRVSACGEEGVQPCEFRCGWRENSVRTAGDKAVVIHISTGRLLPAGFRRVRREPECRSAPTCRSGGPSLRDRQGCCCSPRVARQQPACGFLAARAPNRAAG